MALTIFKVSDLHERASQYQKYTNESANPNIKVFNGWAVQKETFDYLTEISKVMPKLKFLPARACWYSYENGDSIRVIHNFSVYMDEFPYGLGFVGYGNFGVKSSNDVYMVNSRKIKNSKYASHRDQYHMQMTTDFKKAVKLACTYIVPYTIKELAQASYRDFSRNVEREADRINTMAYKLAAPIRDDVRTIITEVKNLIAQGVVFETEAFKNIAGSLMDTLAEQEEERKRGVFGVYARVRTVGEYTYVDTYKAYDVKSNTYEAKDDGSPPTTCLLSELDAELAGNIAVLNMLEVGNYVPRVGYRVDTNTFWLERV
jgi:hypothetical protein